jgi:hypothetical protein
MRVARGAAEHGTVANLAQPMYYQQQEPPEAQSIKSMFHITRILALVFGIILFLAGLGLAALDVAVYESCTAIIGNFCTGLGFILIGPIILLLFGVIDIIIFMKMKTLENMVNARQYEQAKAATLVWMILGFILGGLIIGILLLIAYIKFDPLINSQRAMMGGQPPQGGYPPQGQPMYAPPQPGPGAPPPQMAPAPMAAPPPAAAPSVPFCPTCGQPGTFVQQYGRYYCYTDKVYL